MQHLQQEAKRILASNWRDGFTIPTAKLYPFQWNWDSGFVATGFALYDVDKAIEELQSLFSGQWENGLLPHIIFHSETESTYFPNWDFWGTHVNTGASKKPKTSGITQPPVHGFVLECILNLHKDDETVRNFARAIFPKIVAYHKFLYKYRDPKKEGLFFIFHPWESGRDNSPIWDESLNRIVIDKDSLPTYERRDTKIADAAERPTSQQYDRYVYLLQLGKKHQYDGKEIAEESPFLIQDCMMNAILIQSNKALINVAKILDLDCTEIEDWVQQGTKSFQQKFWDTEAQFYLTYDLRAEKRIKHKDIGGFIPLFAELPEATQAQHLFDYLQTIKSRGFYLCPSFDIDSPLFDSKRYWRGPIWPHMNWMLYKGLLKYEQTELAQTVLQDTLELVDKAGFYEYFESQKSKYDQLDHGFGGNHFSWSASTVLNFLKEIES